VLISEAQEREIHKLLPQTHSPGVDYSLFIMESMEMSLEEVETSPAAPRRSFPPPIYSSCSLFRCFCGAPFRRASGTIFIVGFRSRRSFWKKDRRQRSVEGQDGGSHTARYCGCVGHPLLVLRPPFVCFLRS